MHSHFVLFLLFCVIAGIIAEDEVTSLVISASSFIHCFNHVDREIGWASSPLQICQLFSKRSVLEQLNEES